MKTFFSLQHLLGVCLLIIFSCVGFYIYTQWSLQKFEAELTPLPEFVTSPEPLEIEKRSMISKQSEPTDIFTESNPLEYLDAPPVDTSIPDMETEEFPLEELENPLEDFDPEWIVDEFDVPSDAPVDLEIPEWIVSAWDYSEYRDTDPKYAYEQLGASFQERYGDSTEVNTIIKNVERIDTGTATMDNLIELTEAWISILPAEDVADYEALIEGLESMYTFQDLEALGENVKFTVRFSVEEE
ncbi:MAG: hypothetical protein OXU51_08495 [Candidatus Poribacteria bacterium]|nr:hypothetical protein [Candidatus Poribacteria bacterium]